MENELYRAVFRFKIDLLFKIIAQKTKQVLLNIIWAFISFMIKYYLRVPRALTVSVLVSSERIFCIISENSSVLAPITACIM